jgi:acetylornithine deacetylase/succinyl-diaminopimelate desuccinylase-like protein
MTDSRNAAIQYAHTQRGRFLQDLIELVRIPSISTTPENNGDMQRAAEWLADKLRGLGMQKVEVYPTTGHPIVYGELLAAGPNRATVLVYGHYDVQPPDPLEQWRQPPFEPTRQGENLYGRGASDMKGQLIATLSAIESVVRTGQSPLNYKIIIEGEEEVGSRTLHDFIQAHKDMLACDVMLNPDTEMIAADTPTIVYGLRGLAYFELHVHGPNHDLHSGLYGGVVHNPAQALCELIAAMHDDHGTVALPGFYDHVRPLRPEEHAEFARLPMNEDYYLEHTGVPGLWGEKDYLPSERIGIRPTLEVNGLLSGFTSVGQKTVIPAAAMAKISTRLVPDQTPEEIHQCMRRFLEEKAPKTIHWELIMLSGSKPSLSDINNDGVRALATALEAVWGTRPVFKREGGSVPVVVSVQEILGAPSVMTGFGLPDDNIHAPNEKLHLPTWERGMDALIHFFFNLGESKG